jgi:phenylalanyl-tRNA synthetase beta chain
LRFTYKWLQQYVALKEPAAEIADLLTRQGLEVVSCFAAGPGLPGVVTGRVVTADPHGTASGLVVCRVQIGNGERVILCGAPNVRPGLAVAAALPGARLPDGKQIEAATLYGVLSEGMLCSEYELGISEDHEGIMVLPADTPIGQPLDQALDLTDHVIEVEVTPNRPDCLCVLGIAREIAAKKGRSLRLPETAVREEDESIEKVSSVQILAPEACPRYVARVLGPSTPST